MSNKFTEGLSFGVGNAIGHGIVLGAAAALGVAASKIFESKEEIANNAFKDTFAEKKMKEE